MNWRLWKTILIRTIAITIWGSIALIGTLVYTRNTIAQFVLENTFKKVFKLPLEMESLHIGLQDALISFTNSHLYNPPTFPHDRMISCPDIYVNYNLRSALDGRVHIEELRLHVSQLTITKNKEGKINLGGLKALKRKDSPTSSDEAIRPFPEPIRKQFQIDKVSVKIDTVIYKNYLKAPYPKIEIFPINLVEEYDAFPNSKSLIETIVFKAITNTPFTALTNIELKEVADMVSGAFVSAQNRAADAAQKALQLAADGKQTAKEIAGGNLEPLKETLVITKDLAVKSAQSVESRVKKSAETLKQTASDLTASLNPFTTEE